MSDTSPHAEPQPSPRLGRRRLLGAAAVGGLGLPVLAACGSDEPSTATTGDPSGTGSPTGGPSGSPTRPAAAQELVATADVPVGGGVVLEDPQVVVTQPAEGEFRAFSSICTHQGCPVGTVRDNQIVCPCHGSVFSAEDGSVVTGPATTALTAVAVEVAGGQVVAS